jgi:hypothetical protein
MDADGSSLNSFVFGLFAKPLNVYPFKSNVI